MIRRDFWGQNLIPFLSLEDLTKVQMLSRKFYLWVQPTSEHCCVDFKAKFDVDIGDVNTPFHQLA